MSKILETIVHEFDYRHDFDDIKIYRNIGRESLDETREYTLKNMRSFLTLVKPIGRGLVVGGVVGLIYSLFSDVQFGECLESGAVLGLYLDFNIYAYRYLFRYIKKQFDFND